MVTKGLNKITQNETQYLQLVDNFCKSWVIKFSLENSIRRFKKCEIEGIKKAT